MQDNLVQRRPLICNNAENLKTVRNSIFPFLLFLLLGVNGSNQRLFEGFSIILIILHFDPIFFFPCFALVHFLDWTHERMMRGGLRFFGPDNMATELDSFVAANSTHPDSNHVFMACALLWPM